PIFPAYLVDKWRICIRGQSSANENRSDVSPTGVRAAPHPTQGWGPFPPSLAVEATAETVTCLCRLCAGRATSRLAHPVGDELRDLGRRGADLDAARLESFLLCLRGARRAGDDRPRVSHRLAGRRREAGDVREHRFRHVLADEPRRL